MQASVKIISNNKIAPHYYKMALAVGVISKEIKPGQFFNIRCSGGLNPFLRRPFSAHRVKGNGSVEILYKVIGKATRLLSERKKGDSLDIIGPLGNGFEIRNPKYVPPIPDIRHACAGSRKSGKIRDCILVAGGIGVAPLVLLAEKLNAGKRGKSEIKKIAIIGAKAKKDLLCELDFKKLGFEVLLATEDGSKGKKALATDLLKDLLYAIRYDRRESRAKSRAKRGAKSRDTLNATLYACGPTPMLKEVAKVAALKRMDAYGSFEEHMSCGIGSCYGCVVETKKGYRRVCKDGPVFNLGEIKW